MIRNNSREAIIRRIQAKTGFEIDQNSLNANERLRISTLSDILRIVMIIERFTNDEIRKSRNFSYKISSVVNKRKVRELEAASSRIEETKVNIWGTCDRIAEDILRDDMTDENESARVKNFGTEKISQSDSLRCPACGGNITIHSYNHYKCSNCGLGFTAVDYLNRLNNLINEI